MRPPAEVLADLRERDLYDLCESVARQHTVKMADVVNLTNRTADVVEARHAVWHKLYLWFGGNSSAVARVFGTDPSTVRYAMLDEPPMIIHVVLAKFETEHAAFQFVWLAGRINPYGVTDRVADRTTWFPTHALALAVYAECCAEAGAPSSSTPRAVPADFAAPAQTQGGAS